MRLDPIVRGLALGSVLTLVLYQADDASDLVPADAAAPSLQALEATGDGLSVLGDGTHEIHEIHEIEVPLAPALKPAPPPAPPAPPAPPGDAATPR